MSINFNNSQTKTNLMRAFAGESQARNRYTFAASQARGAKLHVIESIFTFTANQEKEHGEIFYNLSLIHISCKKYGKMQRIANSRGGSIFGRSRFKDGQQKAPLFADRCEKGRKDGEYGFSGAQ